MGDEKMFVCRKCGKEKKESDGAMEKDGEKFCCQECCGSDAKKDENGKPNVCEFC